MGEQQKSLEKFIKKNVDFSNILKKMDKLMDNANLWHLRNQIFEDLSHEDVLNCRRVCKYWNESLRRLSDVKFIQEFGERVVEETNEKLSNLTPVLKKSKIYLKNLLEERANVLIGMFQNGLKWRILKISWGFAKLIDKVMKRSRIWLNLGEKLKTEMQLSAQDRKGLKERRNFNFKMWIKKIKKKISKKSKFSELKFSIFSK